MPGRDDGARAAVFKKAAIVYVIMLVSVSVVRQTLNSRGVLTGCIRRPNLACNVFW